MAFGVIPAVAAWAGQMYGSYSQQEGQRQTNAANIGMAERANESNERMARENRDWQQFMSNTSMRRQVRDYEKAGINPMLGLGGGASTPTGSVSQNVAAKIDNPMSGFAASAQEMANMAVQLRKQKGELELMEKQGKLTDQQAYKASQEAKLLKNQVPEAEAKGSIWSKITEAASSAAYRARQSPEERERETIKLHQNRVKQKGRQ